MNEQPPAGRQRTWVGDLKVALIVLVAVLVASRVADGTTRIVVMLAVAVVVGLLLRFAGVGWRWGGRRRARRQA